MSTLVSAVERGEKKGDYRLAHGLSIDEYDARLNKVVERLPESLPGGRGNGCWLMSMTLMHVKPLVRSIPPVPELYLQTAEQIHASSSDKDA